MNLRKGLFRGLFGVLLLAVSIFVYLGGNGMRPEKALDNFSKLIKKENLDGLSLTIYYLSPYTLTSYPLSVDDLVRSRKYELVINGSELEEHIDLLQQINKQ